MSIQREGPGYTVFQSALFSTTSTVIETGDLVLVVDPTWLPGEVEAIQRFVADLRGNRPLYLLFTHSDWDHVLGYGAFPDAVTIASRGTAEHPDPESVVRQIAEFDDKYYVSRPYELSYPRIDIAVNQDGRRLTVGNTVLTFYLAPGHTADGLFTVVEPVGVFVAGDYLSEIEFPFIYDSSAAYESTMEKVPRILEQHSITVMVPGHGTSTVSAEEVMERQRRSLDYIRDTRAAAAAGSVAETFDSLKQYRFSAGMKSSHEDNLQLFRQELGLNG